MAKKRAREADGASADPNKMNVDGDSSDDDVSCDPTPRLCDAGGRPLPWRCLRIPSPDSPHPHM